MIEKVAVAAAFHESGPRLGCCKPRAVLIALHQQCAAQVVQRAAEPGLAEQRALLCDHGASKHDRFVGVAGHQRSVCQTVTRECRGVLGTAGFSERQFDAYAIQ